MPKPKVKYVPYTWGQFCAKLDYEGPDYMITEMDPEGVPAELREAQAKVKAAYEEWRAIISANEVDLEEDEG